MHLHICTISSRITTLDLVYSSLFHYDDIIWHIAKSVYTDKVADFIDKDPRVRIYELTCDDTDTMLKMNYIFSQIVEQEPDSYFCILDDDSLFHNGMYDTYLRYCDTQFMVIGDQVDKNGVLRLQGSLPYECAIDSSNVLCHSSVLVNEQWGKHWDEYYHVDFDFWNRCFKHFGIKRTDIIASTVSIYNALNNKEDSLDYIRTNG